MKINYKRRRGVPFLLFENLLSVPATSRTTPQFIKTVEKISQQNALVLDNTYFIRFFSGVYERLGVFTSNLTGTNLHSAAAVIHNSIYL